MAVSVDAGKVACVAAVPDGALEVSTVDGTNIDVLRREMARLVGGEAAV